jgi:HEPN domain-containing protein
MNRHDLQRLTLERLKDADILLKAHRAPAAYYLTGYAVECALKACVARSTGVHDFPDLHRAKKSWTHDLTQLVKAADLKASLETEAAKDKDFAVNWALVKDWTSECRYDHSITLQKAIQLYDAVVRRKTGVLRWIRLHW